jgi:hypothetical protein
MQLKQDISLFVHLLSGCCLDNVLPRWVQEIAAMSPAQVRSHVLTTKLQHKYLPAMDVQVRPACVMTALTLTLHVRLIVDYTT